MQKKWAGVTFTQTSQTPYKPTHIDSKTFKHLFCTLFKRNINNTYLQWGNPYLQDFWVFPVNIPIPLCLRQRLTPNLEGQSTFFFFHLRTMACRPRRRYSYPSHFSPICKSLQCTLEPMAWRGQNNYCDRKKLKWTSEVPKQDTILPQLLLMILCLNKTFKVLDGSDLLNYFSQLSCGQLKVIQHIEYPWFEIGVIPMFFCAYQITLNAPYMAGKSVKIILRAIAII